MEGSTIVGQEIFAESKKLSQKAIERSFWRAILCFADLECVNQL